MVWTLLRELARLPGVKPVALCLNEGTLSHMLREAGIETYVIDEKRQSFYHLLFTAYSRFKKRDIQVVHSHRYKENLLAFALSKLLGIRSLVSTLHGLPEPSAKQGRVVPSNAFKIRADLFVLRQAFSRVVAVSENMRSVLANEYKFDLKRLDLIYNGIECPEHAGRESVGDAAVHIGTVGRMVPVKDFRLFLDMADEVSRSTKNVRFSILGNGPTKEDLLKRIRSLNLDERVHLEEPREDPSAFYDSLDIYVNTSVHEGLPLSLLEAMSHGLPVLAPNVGGIPELITHGEEGFLVEKRAPFDFAKWCLELVHTPSIRKAMGEKGQRKVKCRFTSAQMAQSYHRLYESL